MRRIVALVLIIMLIPAIAFSGGNNDRSVYIESVRENVVKMLKALADKYENYADQFDADYIYIMYSYFKTWLSLRSVENAEQLVGIKENPLTDGKEQFDDITRQLEQGYVFIEETINGSYKQWLSGEITNEMFGGQIVSLINAMVNKQQKD